MRVLFVHGEAPRRTGQWHAELAEGARVSDALAMLRATGHGTLADGVEQGVLTVSVWGRKARPDQRLHPDDRIELCRALLVDPKLARRERFRKQGARTAGLFARTRPGAKAGY